MAANLTSGGARPRNRWSLPMWGAAACLLLTPWVAMRFDTGVNWTALDFAVFGSMLVLACGAYELGARVTSNFCYRAATAITVVAGFLMVWINLAVGIIGDEGNPANLMFAGVLLIGIVGALAARLRPRGMAHALAAMAVAQAAIAAVSLLEGWRESVVLSGFFAALWLASAWLFRKAASNAAPGRAR